MSDREAQGFLAAICANPDDDTARLVYADWLDERGQTARAEFIRVQVERAALPAWDGRRARLLVRELALLSKHESAWRAELPAVPGVVWGSFRRGFVATATFDSFARLGAGGAFRAAPVEAVDVPWPRRRDVQPVPGLRELSITGRLIAPDDLPRLADSPLLSTLRTLTVRAAALGVDGLQRLARSPHLGRLAALNVPHNSIGNGGIDVVASGAFPSLTELDLSEPGGYGRYAEDPIVDASGMAVLARWPGLSRLRALALSGNAIRVEGLSELLRSPHAVGLKRLELRDGALSDEDGAPGDEAVREFVTAVAGLQLDALDIGENPIEDFGATHLVAAECLRGLKALHLDRCEFTALGIRKLSKAAFMTTLRYLNLSHNNLGSKGLAGLFKANPAELHTLVAAGCDLGGSGAQALARAPESDALMDLDLSWNGIGDKAARAFGSTAHLRNLLVLRLKQNRITKPAADALATSPLGKRLAVLDLPPGNDPIPDPFPF
jgi:uncharacterized protein (TIGR02996 family)